MTRAFMQYCALQLACVTQMSETRSTEWMTHNEILSEIDRRSAVNAENEHLLNGSNARDPG